MRLTRFLAALLGVLWIASAQATLSAGGPSREPAQRRTGMVAAESAIAAEAGAQVLRDGGNAVDAAVATAFAAAVTLPAAGNLGGGGFLLYRSADGAAIAYDFRETAPATAHARMFLRGGAYDADLHHEGYGAVGVPGTVAGLHLAWCDHGQLPWDRLVAPAIALAKDGFPVPPGLARSLKKALPRLGKCPTALAQFSHNGKPYEPGEILRQPDLARTLRRIAKRGPAGFYTGPVARQLERAMQRNGGWLTRADLRAYRAQRREPVRGTYRGYEILSMPPPSSGGTVLIEMLHVLEGFDLASAGPGAPATIHWMTETMRRAFADRAHFLGDPDFNPTMPVARLTSREYAEALRRTIRPDRASRSVPDRFEWPAESGETTHLSVVDAERNAVALTYTLEASYGAALMAPGTGFLLNNEMGDFNAAPGLTTTNGLIGTPPNLAAPGKRMLSSMTPTIVVKDGRLFLVLGSPGGRTIINTVLEVIVNVIDHQMDLQAAIDAPRFHHQGWPDQVLYEPDGMAPPVVEALQRRGHTLKPTEDPQGAVHAIRLDPDRNRLEGAADRRAPDGAAVAAD